MTGKLRHYAVTLKWIDPHNEAPWFWGKDGTHVYRFAGIDATRVEAATACRRTWGYAEAKIIDCREVEIND